MSLRGAGCGFAFAAQALFLLTLFFGLFRLQLFDAGTFLTQALLLGLLLCLFLFESSAFFLEALLFGAAAGFFDAGPFLFGALLGFDLLAAEALFFETLFFLQPLGFETGLFEIEESTLLLDAFDLGLDFGD